MPVYQNSFSFVMKESHITHTHTPENLSYTVSKYFQIISTKRILIIEPIYNWLMIYSTMTIMTRVSKKKLISN